MSPESATPNQGNPESTQSAVVPDQDKDRDRQQAALLAFARRVNARPNLDVLLQDAVTLLAETVGAEHCGIAEYLKGDRLLLKVTPVHSEDMLAATITREINMDPSTSLAAYTLSSAGPVVSLCLEKERRFSDVFLQKLDFVSVLSVPLYINNKPFGTLSIYCKEQRTFTSGDIAFAETYSNLLVASVAKVQAEAELRKKSVGMTTILDMVNNLVLELSREGRVENLNPICLQMFGWDLDLVIGQRFLEIVAPADNQSGFQDCFRDSIKKKVQQQFTGPFKVADNEKRYITWTILPRMDELGDLNSMLVTGTDCTKETLLANELKQSKKQAERAIQVIRELKAESENKAAVAGEHRAAINSDTSSIDHETNRARAVNSKPDPSAEKSRGGAQSVSTGGSNQAEIDGKPRAENRQSPRRVFRYRQLIAPIHGSIMPSRRKFFQVACEDISAGGLCIIMDSIPDFKKLVVALGRAPGFSFFTAEIVRINEKYIGDDKVYIIGCQFTGRVSI